MTNTLRTGMMLGVALLATNLNLTAAALSPKAVERVERELRRELVTLPFLSVFDHLAFRVEGETVHLLGQVSRPTLKTDAERLAKRIEGVERVVNGIEVLPTSPNDDRLRLALYRAIYGHSALETYRLRALPPISIIVNNGNVTLEGVVLNELQKNIAGMEASAVAGVFSVTNNLRLEGAEKES